MKSTDPSRARVVAEIDIFGAVDTVEHFAEHYPADRMSTEIGNRIIDAGLKIVRAALLAPSYNPAAEQSFYRPVNAPFMHGVCVTEQRAPQGKPDSIDNIVMNPDPSEDALNKLRRLAHAAQPEPESDATGYVEPKEGRYSTAFGLGYLCPECGTTDPNNHTGGYAAHAL